MKLNEKWFFESFLSENFSWMIHIVWTKVSRILSVIQWSWLSQDQKNHDIILIKSSLSTHLHDEKEQKKNKKKRKNKNKRQNMMVYFLDRQQQQQRMMRRRRRTPVAAPAPKISIMKLVYRHSGDQKSYPVQAVLEERDWTMLIKESTGVEGQCRAACRLMHLVTAAEEQHVTLRRDDSGSVGRGSIRRPEQVSRIFWEHSTIPDKNWPLDGSEQRRRRREKRKIPLMAEENLFEAPSMTWRFVPRIDLIDWWLEFWW